MKNVSNACLREMELRRDFYCEAEITFADGTVRQLGRDDFAMSGNGFYEGASSGSFPLGLLIPKYITLSLNNYDDRWSEYDFQWAKIFLKTKFDLSDGTTESINIGNFTVVEPESYGIIVEITAVDDGYKLDREYSTSLPYPASLEAILRDSCLTCGVSLFSSSFENDSFVVAEKPEGITHRQIVGLVAMIAGGNARFDGNNRLKVVPYDFSELGKPGIDGGIFDAAPGSYQTGDSLDGGSFRPWDAGGAFDGGYFGDRRGVHVLYAFQEGLEAATDDVVITGVRLKGSGEEEAFYGEDGYVLSVENVLAKGKEGESARLIGDAVVGLRFRPFSGSHAPYPMAEFGDPALVIDRKNNVYKTVLTDIGFQYYALTEVSCSADSPIRNSSRYASEAAKAIVTAKKLVEKEKTERERAMEELARELAQSSGLYMTKGEQEDGSSIYYMHDKPTLEESMIVWKLTAEAFGISTDGGETYPYGLDVTGLAILNRIYAIGINCNYLTTGSFEVRKDGKEDGKIMVLMDKDTGEVILRPDTFELSSGKTIEDIAESAATGAVDAQTQEDILNRLTNGGEDTGIYLGNDGKLYISFSAAKGDELILGGANNVNGIMKILDSSGALIGSWGNAGFRTEGKYFAVSGDGEMYSNDPVAVGYFRMAGAAGSSLSVSGAKRLMANVLQVAFNTSSAHDTGTYTLRIGNVGMQPGGWSIAKTAIQGSMEVSGDFKVGSAYTKSKEADTENYGSRLLYCYEMPSPAFGDIGFGEIDELGECAVQLDDIFIETIEPEMEYCVFVQKEGAGDVWVSGKRRTFFLVRGTPGLRFSWEVKAMQKGFGYYRLDSSEGTSGDVWHDYESMYIEEINRIISKKEDLLYEAA